MCILAYQLQQLADWPIARRKKEKSYSFIPPDVNNSRGGSIFLFCFDHVVLGEVAKKIPNYFPHAFLGVFSKVLAGCFCWERGIYEWTEGN